MNANHTLQKETKSRNSRQRDEYIIELRQVTKTYEGLAGVFTALKGIDLQVRSGEFIAVVGRSGSGKTTLLNLLAGIDRLTSGDITIAGEHPNALSESALAEWRGRTIGLVFQFFQLLPTLTVLENIMLPMDFVQRVPAADRRRSAFELLDRVGIRDQSRQVPCYLVGRAAAACSDCACARQRSADPARRRADGQPGFRNQHVDPAAVHRTER